MGYPFYVRKKGTTKWFRVTDFGVVQNEDGVSYYAPVLGYAKPKLKDFDTYKPVFPYKKYTNGSHGTPAYIKQRALDFSLTSDYEYCFGRVGTVLRVSPSSGSFQEVQIGNEIFHLVHTDRWSVKSGKYKPYQPLGMIKAMSGSHLHIFSENVTGAKTTIRKILLAQEIEETKPVVPPVDPCKEQLEKLQKENELLKKENLELRAKIDNAQKALA